MIVAAITALTFHPTGADHPALVDVDLQIRAGEILLVQGPSGSGKTTLLRALAGLVPHFHGGRFRGRVEVGGIDTRSARPGEVSRTVGCVFQDPESQAVRATVASDVAFGLENFAVPADEIAHRVTEALSLVGATGLATRDIATLSGGERQRVAIAGVIATRPRLLLLDEPTSQLDAAGVGELDELVRRVAARGTAVVIAEHHAHRLDLHADRVVTLIAGRLVATAPETTAPCGPQAPAAGVPLLEVRDLTAGFDERHVLNGCTFGLAAGTVTALHGANGSGKSTLLRALAGVHPVSAGCVVLAGRDVTRSSPEERVPALGLLPQDGGRRLIHEHVREELAAAIGGLGRVEIERRVGRVVDELDLAALVESHPLELSVGERERVAIGAVLATEPRVILLDEPTRGMDPTRRAQLGGALRERVAEGACALVATHDPQFAAMVADVHLTLESGSFARGVEVSG